MISGFQFSRDSKIGLTEFNNLATGTSYADVVNTLGEPDTTSESLILVQNLSQQTGLLVSKVTSVQTLFYNLLMIA